MKYEYYEQYINKNTKNRYDATPIFENPEVFSNLLDDLIRPFNKTSFNKIAGLDALGFIIGGALAQKKHVGFLPIRKGGKLPGVKGTVLNTFFVDYSGNRKSVEIRKGSVKPGDKILLVDEWIETGSQMKSAIELVEKSGGEVVGISVICARKNRQTQHMFDNYNLKAIRLVDFEGE